MSETIAARIVVTGSSGFVGGLAAARLAAAGHAVLGIDPVPPSRAVAHATLTDDLLDPHRLRAALDDFRPSHIIHAGGVSGPMVLADQPLRIMAANVTGSMNLLEAALGAGATRFVSCSSMAAVGETKGQALPDMPPMRPDSTYGASKAAFDYVLRGLNGRLPMQLCSLSLTAVYGPGRRTALLLSEIVAAAVARRPIRVPPMQSWPYIYGDDAADACIAAAFAPGLRQLRYNVACPERVGLEEIVAALRAAGLDPLVRIDTALSHASRAMMDVSAARRDFDFAPRVMIAEGVRRMVTAWSA